MTGLTYRWLFGYLERLGFEDASPSESARVFKHPQQGTLLAFSMADDASVDRPLSDADRLSVEVHLHHDGLLAADLAELWPQIGER